MEAALVFAQTWGGVIAAGMSVVSAISGAQQQKQAAKYNEKVANQQAQSARDVAAANAGAQRKRSAKTIGTMQAQYAASGVSVEGSPLDVLEQSARDAELDYQNILYGGELSALGHQNTANLERSRGKNAMASGYASAAGSLFAGAASYAGSSGAPESSGYVNNSPNRGPSSVGISASDIGTGGSLGFGGLWRE